MGSFGFPSLLRERSLLPLREMLVVSSQDRPCRGKSKRDPALAGPGVRTKLSLRFPPIVEISHLLPLPRGRLLERAAGSDARANNFFSAPFAPFN